MRHLYDFLAPAYDPIFESIYRPFRTRALERLPAKRGATVLDLASGTGQNFPFLAERIGDEGKIIGVDLSSGMLRRARLRATRTGLRNVSLLQMDVTRPDYSALPPVDFVICSYGFTSMHGWKAAFGASFDLLKPGGAYLIHDVDGTKRSFHSLAVEIVTRSDFSQPVWEPLRAACPDFRMDYLDPSAHLFGGRLFVATGTKPHP
jgi:ubiquinone/menaquinone biosynthesis C-methylase UbiE